ESPEGKSPGLEEGENGQQAELDEDDDAAEAERELDLLAKEQAATAKESTATAKAKVAGTNHSAPTKPRSDAGSFDEDTGKDLPTFDDNEKANGEGDGDEKSATNDADKDGEDEDATALSQDDANGKTSGENASGPTSSAKVVARKMTPFERARVAEERIHRGFDLSSFRARLQEEADPEAPSRRAPRWTGDLDLQ
ncbi:unnamed protein product, partial [Amoebophrya sp. A25]